MVSEAIKLERERRKSRREDRIWELLERPEVLAPLMGVTGALAIQKMGESRIINRDLAGGLFAAWITLRAAKAGITNWAALAGIAAAATATYSVSTPPTDEEAGLVIDPGKLLGGDGKLFWWNIPDWVPWLGDQ